MLLADALDSIRCNDYLSVAMVRCERVVIVAKERAWPDGRVEKCSSLVAEESPGSNGQAAR